MTRQVLDHPCILFALGRESGAFLRECRPRQRFRGAPCPAWFCGTGRSGVLALETGVGDAPTAVALNWLFGQPSFDGMPYRPRLVLSAGFAGALQEGFHVGDVVLATAVVALPDDVWPTTWPGELPPGDWCPPLHPGRLLAASDIASTPEQKRMQGSLSHAVAVAMELAAVAERCQLRKVPFGCVRVISDDVETALSPRLLALLSGGRVSPWRALAVLLASPWLLGECWRLARDTRVAADRLAQALRDLLCRSELHWASGEAASR